MKLAFIGFGDLGNYILEMLLETSSENDHQIALFDDNLFSEQASNSYPFSAFANDEFADFDFYVCLGYRHLALKKRILDQLEELGRNTPYFVHPSAYVHPSVKIGRGSFIYPGCSVDRNSVIGRGVWLANADVVAHDCTIGDCCWFGASVTLSGKVSIGECTFIGSGSVVSNSIQIGNRAIIGLGSVVTKNIAEDQSAIGSPIRILEKKLNLQ